MTRSAPPKGPTPPKKTRQRLLLSERKRRLGLYVVEVARATHKGDLPITQGEIRLLLRKKYNIEVTAAASSEFVETLRKEYNHKVWLRTSGHKVNLFSEDETLVESRAIKALFLATSLIDNDECVPLHQWFAVCQEKLDCSQDDCESYLADYIVCKYAVAARKKEKEIMKLDMRAFREDDFYLRQARKAGMKKRVGRTNHSK